MGSALMVVLAVLGATGATFGLVLRTWAYRAPCPVLGLWVGAMLLVPLGGLTASVMIVTDPHTGARSSTSPVVLAATGSAILLAISVRVLRRFWRLNVAARDRRSRHDQLIRLFAEPSEDLGNVDVVPDSRLFAYSMPCVVWGRVIISQGALNQLNPASLRAVLAHERAHLAGRHHLLLQLSAAIAQSFARCAAARELPARVIELTEMAADCAARRKSGRSPAIAALATLATMTHPAGALPAGGQAVALRLDHLRTGRCCRATPQSLGYYAAVLAVLALPMVIALTNEGTDLCRWPR
jgi:Zn-dependent protease with chaperone function